MKTKLKPSAIYLTPSLVAIAIEFLAVVVGDHVNQKYYSNSADQCNSGTPPMFTTMLIASIGLAIAVLGVVRAFRHGHKILGIFTVLFLIVAALGAFISYVALVVNFCF